MRTTLTNLLLLPKNYNIENQMDLIDRLLKHHRVFSKLYQLEEAIDPILTGIEARGLVISEAWFSEGLAGKYDQLRRLTSDIHQAIGSDGVGDDVLNEDKVKGFWKENGLPVAHGFDALKNYKDLHPTFQLMLEHKNIHMYLRMWDEKLKERGVPVGNAGLIKGRWRSYSSYTGRITARNLPLTSLPVAMRGYVVAPEGYQIFSLDLDNAELRFLAHHAKCTSLIEQFNQGMDVHAETAKFIRNTLNVAGLSENQLRSIAKRFEYSLLYGAGRQTITKDMRKKVHDVTTADVTNLMNLFYEKYPEILQFLNERGGQDELLTPFGEVKPVETFTQTQKKNFTLQSSVSVAIKILLVILAEHDIEVLHIIHDEVWILMPSGDEADRITEKVQTTFNGKIKEVFTGLPTEGILSKEKIGGEVT